MSPEQSDRLGPHGNKYLGCDDCIQFGKEKAFAKAAQVALERGTRFYKRGNMEMAQECFELSEQLMEASYMAEFDNEKESV